MTDAPLGPRSRPAPVGSDHTQRPLPQYPPLDATMLQSTHGYPVPATVAPRLRAVATVTQAALALTLIVHIGVLLAELSRYRLIGRIIDDPGSVTVTQADASDHRVVVWVVAALISVALTAAAFITWFHRARRAGEVFGGQFATTTGWAIGAWFVPILNLVRPARIAFEITDAVRHGRDRWHDERGRVLVLGWWLAFIGGNLVDRASVLPGDTPHGLRTRALLGVVSDVLLIVAAALAIAVVERITRISDARRDAATSSAG